MNTIDDNVYPGALFGNAVLYWLGTGGEAAPICRGISPDHVMSHDPFSLLCRRLKLSLKHG